MFYAKLSYVSFKGDNKLIFWKNVHFLGYVSKKLTVRMKQLLGILNSVSKCLFKTV